MVSLNFSRANFVKATVRGRAVGVALNVFGAIVLQAGVLGPGP